MKKTLRRDLDLERTYTICGPLAGGAVLAVLLTLAPDPSGAVAQTKNRYSDSVIVNTDVLNSLGASPSVSSLPYQPNYLSGGSPAYGVPAYGLQGYGQPAYGQPAYGQPGPNGLVVARPSALLFPPARNPRSLLAPQSRATTFAGAYGGTGRQILQPPPGTQAAAGGQPRSQLLLPPAPGAAPAPAVPSQATIPTTTAPTTTVPTTTASVQNSANLTRAATPPPPENTIVAVPAPPPVPEVPAAPAATQSAAAQPSTVQPAVVAVPEPTPVVAVEEETPKVEPAEPAESAPTVAAVVSQPTTETTALPPPPEPEASPTVATAQSDDDTAQTAAAAPADAGPGTSVLFDSGSADLNDGSKEKLSALAALLSGNESLRVQLLAFASGDEENANVARRLSLSRALVVRSYLIDQGIPATRMQVRALGNKSESGPPDRVDIKPQGG